MLTYHKLFGAAMVSATTLIGHAGAQVGIVTVDEDLVISSTGSSANDEFGRLANSFNDMATHLKMAHTQLEQLSMRDGLTGILNRRAFERALKSETARAKRIGNEFSLDDV